MFVSRAKGLTTSTGNKLLSGLWSCVSHASAAARRVRKNDNVSSITDRETETLERGIYILSCLLPGGGGGGEGGKRGVREFLIGGVAWQGLA